MVLTNRERKLQQRAAYHAAFSKCKHGHGGRWIRKKEVSALGSTARTGVKGGK